MPTNMPKFLLFNKTDLPALIPSSYCSIYPLSFTAKLLQRDAHICSPSFPHSHPHHCNLASPLKLLQPNPFSSHFTLPCKALKIIDQALEKLPSLASTVLLLAVIPFTSFYDPSLTPLLLPTPWCSHLILTSLLLFHSELCSLPK